MVLSLSIRLATTIILDVTLRQPTAGLYLERHHQLLLMASLLNSVKHRAKGILILEWNMRTSVIAAIPSTPGP